VGRAFIATGSRDAHRLPTRYREVVLTSLPICALAPLCDKVSHLNA
jgi:hypothetical protein